MLHLTRSHPAGLSTLFFTEMWERFSYYGVRTLLVLYLVNALEPPRPEALSVVSKQALGMIILGLAFVILAIVRERAELYGRVGPGWLLMLNPLLKRLMHGVS